ncbi:MAG: type II toxin-antitoxin system HipA family toxin [Pseudomonadota bacterium]|nr:type II toxin-antitoxin system HipA family toxin [Pseudomonadota bacterium]
MTTSKKNYDHAFVWIWLPNELHPVVAGKLTEHGQGRLVFNYGKSYLERVNDECPAISIYEPELPLRAGVIENLKGLHIPGCIRDSSPDAWGRRVIINQLYGSKGADTDTSNLSELTYLLESGSDRIGALDFQLSPTEYIPRVSQHVELDELISSAEKVEQGIPLTAELDRALFHGSSIGGARPKALIQSNGKKYVAKFSSSTDLWSIVKAEFIAMRLAKHAGLNVANVHLVKAAHKDVLLVERFDRIAYENNWTRKIMVSALTLFELDDMFARYASYERLAEIIRYKFSQPKEELKELFRRLVFNILCGNTDDHARNHAAFWDGKYLSLTPAYDICPQGRTGNEASQAMLIYGSENLSQLKLCLKAAKYCLLGDDEARDIINRLVMSIQSNWDKVCDEAELSSVDKNVLWERQFLNSFSMVGI